MHPQYTQALALRKQGKSYGEIAQTLGVAKSSASMWCRGVSLSNEAKAILRGKSLISNRKFIDYNNRRWKKHRENKKAIESLAEHEIQQLSRYELLLVGTALYWGEGWKRTRDGRTPAIAFGNADAEMLRLFLRFLREVLEIPKEKISASIQVHKRVDIQKAVKFWSTSTGIPSSRFGIRRQTPKSSKEKRPVDTLPYGTCQIRVNDYKNFSRLKGWINGLAREAKG